MFPIAAEVLLFFSAHCISFFCVMGKDRQRLLRDDGLLPFSALFTIIECFIWLILQLLNRFTVHDFRDVHSDHWLLQCDLDLLSSALIEWLL